MFYQPVILDQRSGETLQKDEIEEIGQPTRWLSTKVINAAMELIRQKFPEIGGLFNCQWGALLQFDMARSQKWIQILFNERDHFVVAAKGFGSHMVKLYDSNWDGINEPEQHLIYCIAKIEKTSDKNLIIGLMSCEKQKQCGSCGLYAIAFATALAHSLNPSELRFDVSKLRSHLMECFQNGEITPFPTKEIRARSNWRPKKTISTLTYCICRMPDFGDRMRIPEMYRVMAQCNSCKNYYHQQCEGIPQTAIDSRKTPWICSLCM